MSTRFYFGQLITAPTLAFSAAWSAPGSTPQRLLMRTVKRKAAPNTAPVVFSASETTAAILNKQHIQLVSMPLGAQTITGTVKGYALFSESDLTQDCRVQCEMRIIAPDGTVRGTLLAADAGALSSEFTTTATNRRIPLLAATNTLTSVTALDGDYLVIEIGHRTHVASATAYTATIRWHDDPATGDLPEDETTTTTTLAPWLEFSQTLLVNDTFDNFAPALAAYAAAGANQTNALTPAYGPLDSTRDVLAEFLASQSLALAMVNRVANQATDTTAPTFFNAQTLGAVSAAGFEPIGQPYSIVPYGADQTNAVTPSYGKLDPTRDILAEFNLAQPISYNLVDPTNSDVFVVLPVVVTPGAAPSVANVAPADMSTITPVDTLGFDVLLPSGARRVLVGIAFPTSGGAPELAHDGSNFQSGYVSSTRTVITNGFRYVLRRNGGWYARPQPLIFAFDVTGQEL